MGKARQQRRAAQRAKTGKAQKDSPTQVNNGAQVTAPPSYSMGREKPSGEGAFANLRQAAERMQVSAANRRKVMGSDQRRQTLSEASDRLRLALEELAKPPEGIVQMLERLQVPTAVRVIATADHPGGEEVLCIRMEDLVAGEQRNQNQGNAFRRIYGHDPYPRR